MRILGNSNLPTKSEDIKHWIDKGVPYIAHPTTVIKKSVLFDVGGYDELYKCSEDYDLWLKIAGMNYKIINTDKPVLKYRIHGENAHIKKTYLQAELCCISRLKYILGIHRNLTKQEFDVFKEIVNTNLFCKLEIAKERNSNIFVKVLNYLRFSNITLYKLSRSYFFKHRKSYIAFIQKRCSKILK